MYRFICGDNVSSLKTFVPQSIDLTITSPPYDGIRRYADGCSYDREELIKQLFRVTKEGGVVVWVMADQTLNYSETGNSFETALLFKKHGWNLYDTMIWAKTNPVPMSGMHERYEQAFEYMFVFSKGKPKTVNLIKDKTSNFGTMKTKHKTLATTGEVKEAMRSGCDEIRHTQLLKTRSNIWYYPVGYLDKKDGFASKHPAVFPENLVYDHINSWTDEKDIVLDPFCGSGTVIKCAEILGRNSIGIDIASEYIELATKRVTYTTNSVL